MKGFCLLALISQAIAVPTLQSRATTDTSAFSPLARAAKLSSAAYTGCIGKAFDVTITKQIRDTLTDTQGYVGYSTDNKKITVVMRGSTTVTDILNDVDTTLVTPSLSGVTFPAGVQIMRGVNRPWSAVHDDVISEVNIPTIPWSQRGIHLVARLPTSPTWRSRRTSPGKEITSNALAAFPIGNEAWANFAGSLKGTLNRGNNAADGVPNMYITIPYSFKHYGTEYYSSGLALTCKRCDGQRDLSCSAGNGMVGVTAGHFQSFGVTLGAAGCGILS
ncbi:hypothetical protein N7509_009093 [Penicillium cosmopolitanum]|uniref:Uncharacterized protein n=1 Tax=Penicillium cosmopolitanum TaxID=1131564 RepID=A0A9W9VNU2_9EURO|nr:uncharacterized protein N7509_009093 [Penicillium cosmopolitanum]KAJ5386552.1 hypothetical protein N7509_009093 [Penicillium cosmopolitanum]